MQPVEPPRRPDVSVRKRQKRDPSELPRARPDSVATTPSSHASLSASSSSAVSTATTPIAFAPLNAMPQMQRPSSSTSIRLSVRAPSEASQTTKGPTIKVSAKVGKRTLLHLPPECKTRRWQKTPAVMKLLSGVDLPIHTWHADTPRALSKEALSSLLQTTNVVGYPQESTATPKAIVPGENLSNFTAQQEKRAALERAEASGDAQQVGYTNDDMAYATFIEGYGTMFRCDRANCQKNFNKVESLRKHISLAHPDSKPCPVCQRRFASHSKLIKHVEKAHFLSYQEDGTVRQLEPEMAPL